MKHLKKFNESESTKYKMELKDYFYDFSDNGFTIVVDNNMITGKYEKYIDSLEYAEMYLDTLTKLSHYFGIVKTLFSNSLTSSSFVIEVKNKVNEDTSIEVYTRTSKTKIKIEVTSYSIYNYPGHIQLILRCQDVNNVFYVLKWEFTQNNDRRLKIGALNGCIDLENTNRLCNNIINNVWLEVDTIEITGSHSFNKRDREKFIKDYINPKNILCI